MASIIYPAWRTQLAQGAANTSLTGNIKVILVDLADYTYNQAHDFLDDVPGAARVATSANITNKTFTLGSAGMTFDADDTSISGVTGDTFESVIGYIDTGTEATSRLVWFMDGLSLTPNGGAVTVQWNALGIFTL